MRLAHAFALSSVTDACWAREGLIFWSAEHGSLDLASLQALYRSRRAAVIDVIEAVYARIAADGDGALWLAHVPREAALRRAASLAALEPSDVERLPLLGVPFAIKDIIDVAGMPTTAACPDFAYEPVQTAPAVRRLLDAGAILVGKTNLDQFATGLVGVRSPYGTPRNPFNADFVPGGSSSGSATAVAKGLVSFSLGTDTAGSGRVPAAFNNIVGVKPTRGAVPASGVVPACRSLDCVSFFALVVDDAMTACAVAAGTDPADSFSRRPPSGWAPGPIDVCGQFQFGVPHAKLRRFFGNPETPGLYERAISSFEALGGTPVGVDYAPFAAAAALLYEGPWLAERLAAIREFLVKHPNSLHPVTRRIIEGGSRFSAVSAFEALYTLKALRRETEATWDAVDFMLLPTAGTIYRIDEIERDPISLNNNLGYYTNFVNLLDLSAVAVPAGFQADGLPFGVSLIGPAWHESRLAGWASAFHRAQNPRLGATAARMPERRPDGSGGASHPLVQLLVVGVHMQGLPLNAQLSALGARFRRTVKTAPNYRFYDIGGSPRRPGLVRCRDGEPGAAIAGEIYDVPSAAFGAFIAQIPAPFGVGKVELCGGEQVLGFLCEAYAARSARDISAFGNWHDYIRSLK